MIGSVNHNWSGFVFFLTWILPLNFCLSEGMQGVAPPNAAEKQKRGSVGRGRAKKKLSMGKGMFTSICRSLQYFNIFR